MKFIIIMIGLLYSGLQLCSQDTVTAKKLKILPVPTFGYAPETTTYVGAVALFNLDFYQNKNTRTSNASLEFTYTWKKQIIVETDWNYFFNHEKWFTRGLVHFSSYPDIIYISSICNDCSYSFDSDRKLIDLGLYRRVANKFFIGANFRFLSYLNVQSEAREFYPDLYDSEQASFGISLLQDSRDNILTATKGNYAELSTFIQSGYQKVILDLRKYFTLGRNDVISIRTFHHLNRNKPPFYDEAYIGGDKYVRGYFYGRYRDRNMSTLQLEYRTPVFWRIGLAAFGGYSKVYNRLENFKSSNWLYNLGTGLRILVDKKEQTNLRMDFALGKDGSTGFYFAFGESF